MSQDIFFDVLNNVNSSYFMLYFFMRYREWFSWIVSILKLLL